MIDYSLVQRISNSNTIQINQAKTRVQAALAANQNPDPADLALVESAVYKTYAQAQYRNITSFQAFSEKIAEATALDTGVVVGILTAAVRHLRKAFLNGEKVQLGDLGNFYVSLKSVPADSNNDFVTSYNIRSVKVKWEPTPRFNDLRSEAEFKRVASRDLNSKVIKAVDGNEEIQFVSAESSDNAQGDSAGSGSLGVNTHLTDDSMNED